MTLDPQPHPALPELKRFLDRLLSASASGNVPAELLSEHNRDAIAYGIVAADAGQVAGQPLPMAQLIQRTQDSIRLHEPMRPADQALETMSAPPAMPEATPRTIAAPL